MGTHGVVQCQHRVGTCGGDDCGTGLQVLTRFGHRFSVPFWFPVVPSRSRIVTNGFGMLAPEVGASALPGKMVMRRLLPGRPLLGVPGATGRSGSGGSLSQDWMRLESVGRVPCSWTSSLVVLSEALA